MAAKGKYKSGLEQLVAQVFDANKMPFTYEDTSLRFIVPETKRRYTPDFRLKSHPNLYIEAKGRFSAADRKKMLLVKEQYPKLKFMMLFGRAQNTLSKKSTTTYGDWCDANGIGWLDLKEFIECPSSLTKNKAGSSPSPQRKNKRPSRSSAKP